MAGIRTDLAIEANELARQAAQKDVEGVTMEEEEWEGVGVTRVRVDSERGARAIGKPQGMYVTLSVAALMRREEDSFGRTVRALARALTEICTLGPKQPVLVAGLGNRAITADSVGPKSVEHVLVTRHLVSSVPEYFGEFRAVAALTPGVLGTTGLESGEMVQGVMDRVRPKSVIAVDALAARRLSRLVRTIQISNTGIVPGSGVGNARTELSEQTLGVPVLAIGVPTVVDGQTLFEDLHADNPGASGEAMEQLRESVVVTTRDIDAQVSDMARVIGYGINLALHPGLGIEDIDLFLS